MEKDGNWQQGEEKIIDVVFAEVEEEDQGQPGWNEKLDFGSFSSVKESWFFKGVSLLLLVISTLGCAIYLGLIALSAIVSLGRRLRGDSDWNEPLKKRWKFFCRGLVIALSSFVGIFSSRFAITIAAVYFSLFDSDPHLMGRLYKAMD